MNDWQTSLSQALRDCNIRLAEFARTLQIADGVTLVTHWPFDLELPADLSYQRDQYVSAELVNGGALDWCIEISVVKNLVEIECAVFAAIPEVYNRFQDVVKLFPNQTATVESDVQRVLSDAASKLVDAVDIKRLLEVHSSARGRYQWREPKSSRDSD